MSVINLGVGQTLPDPAAAAGATSPARAPGTGAPVDLLPLDLSQVSPPGLLLSQLDLLQQSNPAEFKEVVALIADALRSAASRLQGGAAQALQQRASEFRQAAETGHLRAGSPSALDDRASRAYASGVQDTDPATAVFVQDAIQAVLASSGTSNSR